MQGIYTKSSHGINRVRYSVMEGLPGGEGERVRVRLPALRTELLAQCWVIGLLCVNMSVAGGGRGEGVERGKGEKRDE